ncbi:hypothetical protein Tco_0252916 [Tanacetum coccineum]
METEAIDNQANLVNYDNENKYEIEDLGYESEEYTEDAHKDDENNHSNGYAKRGITRLCKFRREYGKPGWRKLQYSNPGTNGASPEARNKLGNELTASNSAILEKPKIGVNFETTRPSKRNLSITNLTPLRFGACQGGNLLKLKMARFQVCFSAYNGEWICTCEEENGLKKKEIEQDEEPTRGTLWLKGRVNKDGEYQDDEIRSVGMYILVDQGTDAMTLVLGKEKGGYARGVGSGVTYKRYFAIPKRQKVVMYDFVLESQLDWLARPTDPIDSRCLRWKFYQNSSVMRGAEKTFLDCDQEWMRAFGRKCKKKGERVVIERILQVKIHKSCQEKVSFWTWGASGSLFSAPWVQFRFFMFTPHMGSVRFGLINNGAFLVVDNTRCGAFVLVLFGTAEGKGCV